MENFCLHWYAWYDYCYGGITRMALDCPYMLDLYWTELTMQIGWQIIHDRIYSSQANMVLFYFSSTSTLELKQRLRDEMSPGAQLFFP